MPDITAPRPITPLTEEQVHLLALGGKQRDRLPLTGLRDYALILCGFYTGLRVSEIANLRLCDLNPARGTLTITHPKGKRSPATVAYPAPAHGPIQRWLEVRPSPARECGYVFSTLKGARLNRHQVWQMIRRHASHAGITTRVTPHLLRHSHSVESIRRGLSVAYLQRQLRHSTLSVTSQYLVGLGADQFVNAVNEVW